MKKIIINNKLKLKKLSISNINSNYLSWLRDEELKKNLANLHYDNLDQLKEYFKKKDKIKNLYFFGIFYENKHIGNLKFENIYFKSKIASWGILIGDKKFRRKKIGYEVLSKSMDFIEKKFRIENFIISVTHLNENAKKLFNKLGFRNYNFKKEVLQNIESRKFPKQWMDDCKNRMNGKIFLIKRCLLSKIVIGTANFGNHYGKRRTYINKGKAKAILQCANLNGINFIDTANIYGKSEYILGLNNIKNFEIISKLPEITNKKNLKKIIKKKFNETLNKTSKKYLEGYLIHNTNELQSKSRKTIISSFKKLKKQKKIKKIGVSVYEPNELNKILKYFKPDIVQLPISIVNQNFLKNNFLKKLKKLGIEIHVRSIFLQGLLLQKKTTSLGEIFNEKIKEIDKVCHNKKISRLKFLLNFINGIKEVDKIIVGIDSVDQLKKIIKSLKNPIIIENYKKFAVSNKEVIDPRLW